MGKPQNFHDATGVVSSVPGIGGLSGVGTALPSGVVGFAPWATYLVTSGSGAGLYTNAGTHGSSAFIPVQLGQYGFTSSPSDQIVLTSDNRGLKGVTWMQTSVTANSSVTSRFVTNANYGSGGVDNVFAQDIEVDGGQTVNQDGSDADVANGVDLDGVNSRILNCQIRDCRGIAAVVTSTGGDPLTNTIQSVVAGNDITDCHTGIKVNINDTKIFDNTVARARDICLHVPTERTSLQSSGNHFYGTGAYTVDRTGSGSAGYIESSEFISNGDKWADAAHGVWTTANAHNVAFTGGFIQHIWSKSGYINGKGASFHNYICHVPKSDNVHPDVVGFDVDADEFSYVGGRITMNWYEFHTGADFVTAAAAFRLAAGADNCHIDTYLDGRSAVIDQTGVSILGVIKGGRFDLTVTGFDSAGSCAFKLASGAIKNCDITIRGTESQNYIDLPGGVNTYATNTITIHDTTNSKKIVVGRGISGATNATPIVITSAGHGLSNGDVVYVHDVLGNTAANTTTSGTAVGNVTSDTFELTAVAGNGTYTANTGWWGRVT